MQINWFERLWDIASELNELRLSDGATYKYDFMADAIVWSDERPADTVGRADELDCIRILLRYRTAVMMAQPDEVEKLQCYWDHGLRAFPNWAGFAPQRRARRTTT